jgi:tetratricopeptide (TPR) repeat protein
MFMRTLLYAVCILISLPSFSQLTTTASGGNKKAIVGERIGLTDVTIHYDRPGVRGREGKIWGELVPVGFTDLGFGSAKSSPWRAGANENTTINFSTDVKIEGKDMPAGTYGVFIAYDPNESTVIFSKNSTSWGAYYYDENEDALRVKVKPVKTNESTEWLRYEFTNQTDNSATVQLVWEKLAIPFKIETDVKKNQIAIFQKELRSDKGFNWLGWNQAAQWCAQNNTNLEQGLQWADSATSPTFGGNTQFQTYATKAQLLTLLGRGDEASALIKANMQYASMQDIHYYARLLITQKKPKEAFDLFKANLAKYPKQFTTLVGMARGYSAIGDYKTALKYAQQAQPIAPDNLNKQGVETAISKLKEGKDMNL